MKRIYQKISYFLKDDKFLKLRRKIIAWFSLIIWIVSIGLTVVCVLLLFGKLIEIDATQRFAFGEGIEILKKSFINLLGIIVLIDVPLIAVASFLHDFWDKHFNEFVAFLTGKDTPKNEDH